MKTVEPVEPTETYSFEKKFLDRGFLTLHFNVRYIMLKGLGLNGYTVFVFAIGVVFTLFVSQFF
jgi:hypothetical protein